MRTNGYQTHFDEEVLAANPLKLVLLLYAGALDSIASARRFVRLGDIAARSRAISKAMSVVTELSLSLNHQTGGELSRSLADLYSYVETLLIQANTEQCERPLMEAEAVLSTLLEAWRLCGREDTVDAALAPEPVEAPNVYEPVRARA
jgi:flagellar protein FliS